MPKKPVKKAAVKKSAKKAAVKKAVKKVLKKAAPAKKVAKKAAPAKKAVAKKTAKKAAPAKKAAVKSIPVKKAPGKPFPSKTTLTVDEKSQTVSVSTITAPVVAPVIEERRLVMPPPPRPVKSGKKIAPLKPIKVAPTPVVVSENESPWTAAEIKAIKSEISKELDRLRQELAVVEQEMDAFRNQVKVLVMIRRMREPKPLNANMKCHL
jgi:DnaK suppressor protein